MIFAHRDYPIEKYTAIYKRLLSYKNELEKRLNVVRDGEFWWQIPYTITYRAKLLIPKIIYPETTVRRSEFCIDNDSIFIDKTCFMITGVSLHYLNAVLASKVMEWYLETELRLLGKNSIQYSKQYIENVPIPKLNKKTQEPFIKLVDEIMENKKQGKATADLEREIDIMVYKPTNLLTKKLQLWKVESK